MVRRSAGEWRQRCFARGAAGPKVVVYSHKIQVHHAGPATASFPKLAASLGLKLRLSLCGAQCAGRWKPCKLVLGSTSKQYQADKFRLSFFTASLLLLLLIYFHSCYSRIMIVFFAVARNSAPCVAPGPKTDPGDELRH